ncbi:solute carrier family 13 member 2-like isoform X2 [Macrobrachium rosenbergii]|uniref:solute carrier family 13 member 2-like isoform X2 n=1 Tax=Macrobrachium rosenbergii TaxID=79674 RepID=UPI0034D76EE3
MRPSPSIIWLKNNWRYFFVMIVPLLLAIMPIVGQHEEAKCGYVILVMACYWMTEVIPMAVTSLIPVFAFPLLGILSTAECCLVYMKTTNMMFLGGLMVAVCVEHCHLHKRIALMVILRVGQSPARLMAGFMIVTTFLSMWISNTATTAMMVSIVNAILDELYPESIHDKKDELETSDNTDKNKLEMVPTGVDNQGYVIDNPRVQVDAENGETATGGSLDIVTKSADEENRDTKPMKTERDLMARALLLGVAYSSNTGGTGVVTGTAPNLVMMSVLENSFSQPSGLNFATWILFNVPGMLVCNLLAWIWLQILFMGLGCKKGGVQKASKEKEEAVKRLISRKYEELGRITQHEITVLLLFFLLVALWLFRAPEIYSWLVIDLHPQ